MDAFSDCIINDTTPQVTGEDGRATTEVFLSAYKSVVDGKTVNLPLTKTPDLTKVIEKLENRE
jgi:predicted dehydrogenase